MKIILMHNNTPIQMMGIIIVTKNGRVIAIDGGKCGDADEFKRLVTENGGEIDLWLITHPHRDHYETLIELSQRKDSSIKVGKVCYNPTPAFFKTTEDAVALSEVVPFDNLVANPFYNTITVNKGDRFQVDNVTIDVLRVANPETKSLNINDLSVVYSITEKKDDGTEFRFIVLGDLHINGGRELLEFYKDEPSVLKADAVQMAHHGQKGAQKGLYDLVDANVYLWPTPMFVWKDTTTYQIGVTRKWVNDGKDFVLADPNNIVACLYEAYPKNPTKVADWNEVKDGMKITLPYNPEV